jgi:CRISPR-associated helicase Cas3
VYPTNALVVDQARSIQKLLSKIGKRFALKTPIPDVPALTESGDVSLYLINGETLKALAKSLKTSEGSAWLSVLRNDDSPQKIFLTNPEVLFFLFLQKFSQSKDLFNEILRPAESHTLILDEFHLYYGYSLATVCFMLSFIKGRFDKIIFSSATPIDLPIFKNVERISARQCDQGDVIQHELQFEFYGLDTPLSPEDVPRLCQLIEKVYSGSKENEAEVVVILNSVLTAYWLSREIEKKYPGCVTQIHGLVPQEERPKPEQKLKPIVIGTSAIEVGIDFDTQKLIFEADNTGSFIQRLGRGGRHAACHVIAIIPSILSETFRRQLNGAQKISRSELLQAVNATFDNLPSYADFLESEGGDIILASILASWEFELKGKITIQDCVNDLLRQINPLPADLENKSVALKNVLQNKECWGILKSLAKSMSVRSTLSSLPAFFDLKEYAGFDLLSLDDLSKVVFEVQDIEEVKKLLETRGKKLPLRLGDVKEILVVKEVQEKKKKICISFDRDEYRNFPSPLRNFAVIDLENKERIVAFERLLTKQPAFLVDEKSDWRLLGLRACSDGYLVLGGDALVAWSENSKVF